jgi:NADPH:quinone reductase
VIGTASTEAKRDFVRGLGAEAGGYGEVGGAVDLALGAVDGEVFDAGLKPLRPGGRMIRYGAIGGKLPTIDAHGLFELKWVTGWPGGRARPEQARADMAVVSALWDRGRLTIAVAARVPLAEVARGYEILDDRADLGRVMLIP